jgi:hypothetical protein
MGLGTVDDAFNSRPPSPEFPRKNIVPLTSSVLSKTIDHRIPLEEALRTNSQKKPNEYQLLSLDSMISSWLDPLKIEGNPITNRDTILLGDEGGMGKTYSAALVASHYLAKNPKSKVLALVPPKLIEQWRDTFRELSIPCKVPSRPRSFFENGMYPDGTVVLLSKYIPMFMSEPTREQLRPNLNDFDLCILDEAHEGMIAGASDESAKMSQSLKNVIHHVKKTLLLTATPIRNTFEDLIALLRSSISETHQIDVDMLESYRIPGSDWFEKLKSQWFPLIEKLRQGTLNEEEIELLIQLAPECCVFVEQGSTILGKLREHLPQILVDELDRTRLARDLHPVGKYFIATLRDDLGRDVAASKFRSVTSYSHFFPENEQYNEIAQSYGGNGFNNTIFKSCPLNANHSRYKKSFPALEVTPLDHESLQESWGNDPRLFKLQELLLDIGENTPLPSKGGMVVFCKWAGTVEALYDWANSDERFFVRKLIGLERDPDKMEYDYEAQLQHKRDMDIVLDEMREAAYIETGDEKIPVLICGEGGSVGLNMEWANRIVHWDISFDSPEMISQKNWRLDRMYPEDNPDEIDESFEIHYFVIENDRDRIETTNKHHRQNRLFVGDRRYIEQHDTMKLIPDDVGCLDFPWTEEPRLTQVATQEMHRFLEFLDSQELPISAIAEYIGHQFIHQSIGSSVPLGFDDTPVSINRDNRIMPDFDDFIRLLSIASPSERKSLQALYGGHMRSKSLIRRFGPPSDSEASPTQILPDGQLQSRLHNWVESGYGERDISEYPMFALCETLPDFVKELECQSSLKITSHQGLLKLRMYELDMWNLFTKAFGSSAPSGVIMKRDDGPWEHVSVGQLTDLSGSWIKLFSFIAKQQDEIVFHSKQSTSDLEADRSEFYEDENMRWDSIFSFESSPDAVMRIGIEMMNYIRFTRNLPDNFSKNLFYPIIEFDSHGTERELCPICAEAKTSELVCEGCGVSKTVMKNGIEFGWC